MTLLSSGEPFCRVVCASGLTAHDARCSCIYSHEIAYIFGQLCSPYSVPSLLKVLANEEEDEMVRHEAAEALGSIASDDVLPTLHEFAKKGPRVVRESCEVALDMYEVS